LNEAVVDATLAEWRHTACLQRIIGKAEADAARAIPLDFLTPAETKRHEAEMASWRKRFVGEYRALAHPPDADRVQVDALDALPVLPIIRHPAGRTSHGPRPVHRKGSRRNSSRGSPDDPDGEPPSRLAVAGVAR
jgi:hypothetical protein